MHRRGICIAAEQSVNAGATSAENISGAVMANKKLSVILNREGKPEGVKRQWRGVGECLVLSIMDSPFEGGIFSERKLLVGGMWRAEVIHARTADHVRSDKAEQTRD